MIASAFLLICALQEGITPWQAIPNQDALRYSLVIEPDFSSQTLAVECRYQFRALKKIQHIYLDHPPSLQWEVQFWDEQGQSLFANRVGTRLILDLPKPLKPGEEFSFVGKFFGKPPGGFLFRKSRSGKMVAFTDHFAAKAREWLPCVDHPSDRARFEVEVHAPAGMEVVASGVLEPEGKIYRTVADIQTYLFAIGIGPWAKLQEQGDDRFVPHLVYPKDVPKARRALQYHGAWMQTMEAVFGPYLYGKFCVVQIPTRWGGMENAGNVWLNERIFDGRDRGVGTLAHEFVHQWFGDAVGYGIWKDAWLSEGFASYFGPWLHEQEGGGAPLQRAMNGARRSWLRSSAGKTRPIRWDGFSDPDDLFGSSAPNTYQKGAWVLHMLRGEMGDEAFFAGLAAWYQEFSGRPAATADLQAAMSEATGQDLAWFFRQWLDQPGCPEFSLKWDKTGADLQQISEGAPWRFPLKVAWVNADGEKEQKVFAIVKVAERLELGPGFRTPVLDPAVELLFRPAQ